MTRKIRGYSPLNSVPTVNEVIREQRIYINAEDFAIDENVDVVKIEIHFPNGRPRKITVPADMFRIETLPVPQETDWGFDSK